MDTPATVVLSERLGIPVVTQAGHRIGHVADLTVRLGPARPSVSRLLVKAGRSSAYQLNWADVAEMTPTRVVLRANANAVAVNPTRPPLETHDLLLARDVMDTQVVDLRERRLSRVSDVLLRQTADGLEVVAVDLGTAGLLRRLGLGWLTRRLPLLVVDWADLHLTSRRGHAVQLSTRAASFHRLDSRGLAELLTRLSTQRATDVIRAVDPAHAAAALHHSHSHTGRRLVHALSTEDRRRLVAAAAHDHAHTITELGKHTSPIRRRRFLRTSGWRLRRPPEG